MSGPMFQKMMREQIQEHIQLFKQAVAKPRLREGWIKAMRTALGMTTYQLARRLECGQSNITKYEGREQQRTITLKTLDEVAKGLNCRLVYAFVPEKDLSKMLEDQARAVIRQQISSLSHSMQLEQQGLSKEQAKKNEDLLVEELLTDNPKKLWETI